jgi:hypothetical protein
MSYAKSVPELPKNAAPQSIKMYFKQDMEASFSRAENFAA